MSCFNHGVMLNNDFKKSEIMDNLYLEFIGDNFFIENFSKESNFIEIKCTNKYNNKIIKNLPLWVSWTHQKKQKKIMSNSNGIATFQLSPLWTSKKNQVLRVSVIQSDSLFNQNMKLDSSIYFIETNIKTKGPKIFLEESIKNLGKTSINDNIIEAIKEYFTAEFFVEFTKIKIKSDFVLNLNVDTFESKIRSNLDLPYIINTSSNLSLKINNANKNDNIFHIELPSVKAGDYDKKHTAGKKAINNLAKYIMKNKILREQT